MTTAKPQAITYDELAAVPAGTIVLYRSNYTGAQRRAVFLTEAPEVVGSHTYLRGHRLLVGPATSGTVCAKRRDRGGLVWHRDELWTVQHTHAPLSFRTWECSCGHQLADEPTHPFRQARWTERPICNCERAQSNPVHATP